MKSINELNIPNKRKKSSSKPASVSSSRFKKQIFGHLKSSVINASVRVISHSCLNERLIWGYADFLAGSDTFSFVSLLSLVII